jgi:hypothetical protein
MNGAIFILVCLIVHVLSVSVGGVEGVGGEGRENGEEIGEV